MFTLDDITNEYNKQHSNKWPHIPNHPYRMLIIGSSGSEKTNAMLSLIIKQDDIEMILR